MGGLLFSFAFLVCCAGVIYPFRPFKNRSGALLSSLVFGTLALLSQPAPSSSIALVGSSTLAPTTGLSIRPDFDVPLEKFTWTLDGFGNVFIASFRLHNKTTITLKDFSVECDVSAPSGTKVGRVGKIIYHSLAPGKTKQFRDVNFGFVNSQSRAASCRVTGFVTP